MFGVYLFSAVLGAGLVLFSLLGGAGEDVGLGEGLEGDAGTGAMGGSLVGEFLLGFFRVRNLTFLLAGFGVTGVLGTWLGLSGPATATVAAGMGLFAMLLVHVVFIWLHRSDSAVDLLSDSDLEGSFARVVVPMAPGARGRIACVASGQQLYLTARLAADAADPLPVGAPVVILRMMAGVAEVAPAPALELSSSTD